MSTLDTYKTFVRATALASRPKPGNKLVDLRSFGILPELGGRDGRPGGTNQLSDVLVTQTQDGIDLNDLYSEFQATVAIVNQARTTLVDFFSYSVTNPIETVTQLGGSRFERASEYGEPRGIRQKPTKFHLGFDFDWYDIGVRFTWQYLAEATALELQGLNNSVIEADNQLVFGKVMEAIYRPDNREATIDGRDVPVYALYNGDGTTPPKYKGNTFDGTHSHYLTSGATQITPTDLEDMIEHLRHHGYGPENGVRQVFGVNPREGKVIRKFNVASGANYDFIPAQGQPLNLILEPGQVVSGGNPPATYAGMTVIGSYADAIIIEDDLFPASYVVLVGTGGRANLNNPVGIREHANASLRGLRLVKGRDNDYPLIDSFYQRGLGTGIRQRGGSVVMQITANASYTAPATFDYDLI